MTTFLDQLLETAGLSAHVAHFRFDSTRPLPSYSYPPEGHRRQHIYPTYVLRRAGRPAHTAGGATRVELSSPEGIVLGTGYAYCSPKDSFCRATGRRLATERAFINFLRGE